MARTTISLPDDLKSEMDKVGGEANWSAIAATAFRSELNRIKSREAALKGDPMNAAINRLRASKEAYAQQAAERGKSAGTKWARESAEYGELKSLAEHWPQTETCETDDAHGPARVFVRMIGMSGDRNDVNDFWSRLWLDERDPDKYSSAWWGGFVDGALEAFLEFMKEEQQNTAVIARGAGLSENMKIDGKPLGDCTREDIESHVARMKRLAPKKTRRKKK